MGVAWASLGVLTAAVFGMYAMFFFLGSKMDAQRTELRSEIGEVRIDLGSRIDALGDRLDGLNARLDTHMDQRHTG